MNPFRTAQPVWTHDDQRPNVYIECRETVNFDGRPVTLTLSVDTQYAAYLNGRLAAWGQYTDYPDAKVYETADLTSCLQRGENDLRIVAYCQNAPSSTYRPGKPWLIYTVTADDELLCASGERTLCRPHPCFFSGETEKITGQLGYSFRYDGRVSDDVPWQTAQVIDGVTDSFLPRPILPRTIGDDLPIRLCRTGGYRAAAASDAPSGVRMQTAWRCGGKRTMSDLPGKTVTLNAPEGADGVAVILDLGRETVGFLSLDLDLPADAEILIGWGEHLDDGHVRTEVGGRNFAAQYMARAGRNTFLNPFRRLGLRYLELHIAAPSVTLYYAGVRSVDYPLPERRFAMADPLHDRIMQVGLRTMALCMHEHYEDCPWREQALYAMDSRNQMLCGYYSWGEFAFARASIALMGHSLREDAMLELCSPAEVAITIPSFTAVWITQLWEYLTRSEDADFVRQMLPTARAIAEGFLARTAENGLLTCMADKKYWNFYEWSDGLSGKIGAENTELTYDAPLCAFVSMAYRALAAICDALGAEDASRWADAHAHLNAAMHAAFYDAERGLYASYKAVVGGENFHYAELTQSLCLYAGACPAGDADRVRANLASGAGLIPVTLSHSIYKYEALLADPDRYGDYVRREIERIWGGMLMKGATTFWETEKGAEDFHDAGSLCHGWSAVPVYLYGRYADVLGLDKEELDHAER
ncbi:MAG: family 78 glycoside hydrolase catalytic domain [Clostridia bacterium]|nr:family 78 glycoside hydrolase catalytic domain [Clostridia bacterium]